MISSRREPLLHRVSFALVAVLFPIVSVTANQQVTALLLLLTAWAFVQSRILGVRWSKNDGIQLAWIALAVLAALGAASTAWSIVPDDTLERSAKLTALSFLCWVLWRYGDDYAYARAAPFSFAGIMVLLILFLALPSSLYPNVLAENIVEKHAFLNRPGIIVTLTFWPLGLFLLHKKRYLNLTLVCAGLVLLLGLLNTPVPVVAIACGFAVAFLTYFFRRTVPLALCAILFAGIIATPFFARSDDIARYVTSDIQMPYSWIHRTMIWRFTADRILERPILGWGLDSSPAIPGGDLPVSEILRDIGITDLTNNMTVWTSSSEALPLHPHNAFLQAALELGMPGALLFGAILCALYLSAVRRAQSDAYAAALTGFITSALLVAAISLGSLQTWWIATLILCGKLLHSVSRETSQRSV